MDWTAIASILAERSEHPIVLLDKNGRIRIFNHAMEQILGWTRFHVEGQLWAEVCTPPDLHAEAGRWITEALRGALRSYVAVGLTNAGQRIAFRFEFSLVGRGAAQGLLATAMEARALRQPTGDLELDDLDYEVVTNDADFGQLVRITVKGEWQSLSQLGVRCFALIHKAQRACEHCPARKSAASWPRTSVRYRTEAGKKVFEVTTAEEVGQARVHVRLRLLPELALDAIHAAKVEDLAQRASLSPREREVLSYLLLGRTVEDISQAIGIAVRTVKYHQASVLSKLGADSRADLMRLLF